VVPAESAAKAVAVARAVIAVTGQVAIAEIAAAVPSIATGAKVRPKSISTS
jgi:hypothetical protein